MPHGNPTGQAVADVSLLIGKQIIQGWGDLIRKTGQELIPASCAVDTIHTTKVLAGFMRSPTHGESFRRHARLAEITYDRSVSSGTNEPLDFALASDTDLLFPGLDEQPFMTGEISVRLQRMDFLPVNFHIIT